MYLCTVLGFYFWPLRGLSAVPVPPNSADDQEFPVHKSLKELTKNIFFRILTPQL